MQRFFICSANFCEERMLDFQRIYHYLVKNCWQPVKKISEADLVIIGGVFWLKDQEDTLINLMKYYSGKKSKYARTVIIGYMSGIIAERLRESEEFTVVYPSELNKFDDIINAKIKLRDIREPNQISADEISYRPILKRMLFFRSKLINLFSRIESKEKFFRRYVNFIKHAMNYAIFVKSYINPVVVTYGNNYFYLRISKGCSRNCSYCTIKFATGAPRSSLMDKIVLEFKEGLDAGLKVFYLAAEDVGSYGIDVGMTILDLFNEIFRVGDKYDYKLIIPNFNPEWFIKYYDSLEKILLKNQKKIIYLQLPVQSGSDRILKLMGRAYRVEDLKRCLSLLQKKAPLLNIATDIIVGFPGENEEDFNKTKELLQEINFSYAEIFSYEETGNALSAKLDNKVPQEIIYRRKVDLLKIQNKKAKVGAIFKKINDLVKEFVHDLKYAE